MRYYSILSGETLDESVEDISLNELRLLPSQAKMVPTIRQRLSQGGGTDLVS
jgi:hypothetical protein